MIIYFDESYDNQRQYLLYGALFVPASSTLHRNLLDVRAVTGYRGEIKYTRCKNEATLGVYRKVIDAFIPDTAYFRCVVVDQHGFDYEGFGHPDEPRALKQARAYKKFAEMLIAPYVKHIEDAVFLADGMTRCSGDEFLEKIRERFSPPGRQPTFRHLAEVPSSAQEHQCLQVCDLLLGSVLNNLKPPRNRFKNEIRQYLCSRLEVRNFLPSSWKDVPLSRARDTAVKFNVWFWSAKKKPR